MKRIPFTAALGLLFTAALSTGCTSNVRDAKPGEDPAVAVEEARDQTRAMAQQTLQDLYAVQPKAKAAIDAAAGYAVFSNFGMKILVAGGGSGKGIAVGKRDNSEIFMRMAEVQAGLGFGIKKFRLVWVFQDQASFDRFVNSGYELGGQASLAAQAGDVGAAYAGAVSVSPGVWLYQITDNGLAAELTVKGTRYYRDKALQ